MKCTICGTEFNEGIFCPECGAKNEEMKTVEAGKTAEESTVVKAPKMMKFENDVVKKDAEKAARKETTGIVKGEDDKKIKQEKKINRKAIISLFFGIASWIGILTVIIPLVGGIWSMVDGIKALKGKTKYKKSAIIGMILSILVYAFIIIICVDGVISDSKREEQLNSYVENSQYIEAQKFIAQEYKVGTLSYVERCAQLYELQGMYNEVIDLWVEYCSNEYEPIDIPDFRINKLNEYIENHEADLRPETIEKVQNLISDKELAKAEEQVAKEEKKEENILEVGKNISDSEEEMEKEVIGNYGEEKQKIDSYSDEFVSTDDWSNSELAEEVSYDRRGYYTIANFPYSNSKEADKLIEFYQEALKADKSEFINMEYTRKSITNGGMQYKPTSTPYEYKYYGGLKDGLPDGQGLVMGYISNYGCFLPRVLGNFREGQLNGYSITFRDDYFLVESEGNYKNGVENDDYIEYSSVFDFEIISEYDGYIRERKRNGINPDVNIADDNIFIDVPLMPNYIYLKGKYKNGNMIKEWTQYYSDGAIRYKGEMKNGEYHGKGTLYKEDGSIEYKGKFKNGDRAD